MANRQQYNLALQQLRRDPGEVTDAQLDMLRARDPRFGQIAAQARDRHRRGVAYQEKLAEAATAAAYRRDVDRRHLAQGLAVRPGDSSARQDVVFSLTPKKVVRMDPKVR